MTMLLPPAPLSCARLLAPLLLALAALVPASALAQTAPPGGGTGGGGSTGGGSTGGGTPSGPRYALSYKGGTWESTSPTRPTQSGNVAPPVGAPGSPEAAAPGAGTWGRTT